MTAPFPKILIANRGEIACRVIRTAREMDIATVAVFSDADRHALHVALADEAVHVGPAAAAESYLGIDRILDAARRTGARAIHPGYGFLSENAEFAEACAASGIVFIGPPADAIRKMGLKDEAKRLMTLAGVPVVPGWLGTAQDETSLLEEARKIGFPVLVKAVAGGGGKGMRKVASAKDFPAALRAAKREAAGAFGNDHVLIENYLEKPRHIEVQVFADAHGNAVHLFERDCSLQRRHQKVIEEAPAPGMPQEMRARMGAAAVEAALAIDYRGAGTIEFIVDVANGLEDAPFYFMEMNTRLQVEHPVTERITGVDLVEWQLRVAAGEPLPMRQEELAINGHAVEVRLYAEDPDRDFLPASGRLERFRTPDDDVFARVDTGVREGDEVSVHYDPMIAKIVTRGHDREAALAHMARTLARTEVAGLATNLDFLRRAVGHPAFLAGDIDTGFIARHAADLMPPAETPDEVVLAFAALAILAAREDRAVETALASAEPFSPWHRPSLFRPNLPREDVLRLEDRKGDLHEIPVRATGGGWRLGIGGRTLDAAIRALDEDGDIAAEIDGIVRHAGTIVAEDAATVTTDGRTWRLRRISERFEPEEDAEGGSLVTAPMPGKVLDISVAEGDSVEKGQPLLILEAMKMEHALLAPRAGKIARIGAAAGDQVADGTVLVEIADPDGAG